MSELGCAEYHDNYTPPAKCGHTVYETETCTHCIYTVMVDNAKLLIEERDAAKAEVQRLQALLHSVAEKQREACAQSVKGTGPGNVRRVRTTPLVSELPK